MTLSQLARVLGRAAVLLRDVNAVRRGRVGQRVWNRVAGRGLTAIGRRLWR